MMRGADYTRQQVAFWASSLHAPAYIVRLVPAGNVFDAPGRPRKQPVITEACTYEQLVMIRRADDGSKRDTIRFLRAKNMEDHHVYARPCAMHHVVIDDLDADGLAAIRSDGLAPNATVWTSEGSWQAWIKLIDEGELSPAVIAAASRLLAARYGGDRGATGAQRFGRLPGFANRKSVHQSSNNTYPFAELIKPWRRGVTPAASRIVEEATALAASSSSTLGPVHCYAKCHDAGVIDPRASVMTIAEALEIYEEAKVDLAARGIIKNVADRSSVDFEIARHMHLTGMHARDIAAIISLASLKARERSHEQAVAYARRTVARAL